MKIQAAARLLATAPKKPAPKGPPKGTRTKNARPPGADAKKKADNKKAMERLRNASTNPVKAASPEMKPELDKAMKSLTTVLGADYTAEEHDGMEDVYWEFNSGRPPVGDHVLFAVMYDSKKDGICFEFEGEALVYKSKTFKSASELLMGIRMWARSKHSNIQVESTLLSKLARLSSQA